MTRCPNAHLELLLAIPIAAKVPDGGTPAAISESEVANRSALAGTSAAPGTPAPTPIPVPASAPAAVAPAAAGLRGWPLKVSGNGSTGKVNGVMVGLPDGRVTGLTAHFGGFLGLGGRNVFVSWDRVTPDIKGHVLRARMTAAEFTAAPAGTPKP